MKTTKDEIKVLGKGVHTLTLCDCNNPQAMKIVEAINRLEFIGKGMKKLRNLPPLFREKFHQEYRRLQNELNKFKTQEFVVENIIVDTGLNAMARSLAGDLVEVNYTALGSNSTAPDPTDTTLNTETFRKTVGAVTPIGNVTVIEAFFNPVDVLGNFEEYGNFINGTDAVDSGVLLNRFLQSISKGVGESLNVSSEITFNDA